MKKYRFTVRDRMDANVLRYKRWEHFTLAEELEDKRPSREPRHRKKFWRLSELLSLGIDGSFMKSRPKT